MKFLVFIITLLLMTSTIFGQTWNPSDYDGWTDSINPQKHSQLVGVMSNYRDGDTWSEIDDRFIVTPDSAYCHTAIMLTTVYPDGSVRIKAQHETDTFAVTQELVGVGWINKSTWGHAWIDQTMTWSTPTVDSNKITWAGVSPGVNYSVGKRHGSVKFGIQFKPAFIDSAVVLYNQRPDSLDIGLANVIKFTFENISGADSAVGDVTSRKFRNFARWAFGLADQRLHFPGSDSLRVRVRQYWKRVGSDLYCIEWVPMRQVKQVYEVYPSATIWHNANQTIGGGASNNDADSTSNGSFSTTLSIISLGSPDFGLTNRSGWRFDGVNTPQGSTIDSASIIFWGSDDESATTVNLVVYCEDVDDGAVFDNTTNWLTKWTNLTSASFDWDNVASFSFETFATSPSIAAPVQEVISRGSWSATNAIVILIADNGSGSGVKRSPNTYDFDGASSDAHFYIEWTVGAPGPSTFNFLHDPAGIAHRHGDRKATLNK